MIPLGPSPSTPLRLVSVASRSRLLLVSVLFPSCFRLVSVSSPSRFRLVFISSPSRLRLVSVSSPSRLHLISVSSPSRLRPDGNETETSSPSRFRLVSVSSPSRPISSSSDSFLLLADESQGDLNRPLTNTERRTVEIMREVLQFIDRNGTSSSSRHASCPGKVGNALIPRASLDRWTGHDKWTAEALHPRAPGQRRPRHSQVGPGTNGGSGFAPFPGAGAVREAHRRHSHPLPIATVRV